jgi:hypothetical protein
MTTHSGPLDPAHPLVSDRGGRTVALNGLAFLVVIDGRRRRSRYSRRRKGANPSPWSPCRCRPRLPGRDRSRKCLPRAIGSAGNLTTEFSGDLPLAAGSRDRHGWHRKLLDIDRK